MRKQNLRKSLPKNRDCARKVIFGVRHFFPYRLAKGMYLPMKMQANQPSSKKKGAKKQQRVAKSMKKNEQLLVKHVHRLTNRRTFNLVRRFPPKTIRQKNHEKKFQSKIEK